MWTKWCEQKCKTITKFSYLTDNQHTFWRVSSPFLSASSACRKTCRRFLFSFIFSHLAKISVFVKKYRTICVIFPIYLVVRYYFSIFAAELEAWFVERTDKSKFINKHATKINDNYMRLFITRIFMNFTWINIL